MTRDDQPTRDQSPHRIGVLREAPQADQDTDAGDSEPSTPTTPDPADDESRTRSLKPTHIPSRSPGDELV